MSAPRNAKEWIEENIHHGGTEARREESTEIWRIFPAEAAERNTPDVLIGERKRGNSLETDNRDRGI